MRASPTVVSGFLAFIWTVTEWLFVGAYDRIERVLQVGVRICVTVQGKQGKQRRMESAVVGCGGQIENLILLGSLQHHCANGKNPRLSI